MFGLGNAMMTMGTMSWTLLGAQGRYRLGTAVVCVVSWCITLPLAAICSVWLKITLEGQTASVVIGYCVAAAVHAYFLFRSDWVALSNKVMDDNDSRASDDMDIAKPTAPATTNMPSLLDGPSTDSAPHSNLAKPACALGVESLLSTGITGQWTEASKHDELEIDISDRLT